MPAGMFELIYSYFLLSEERGAPPSMTEMGRYLKVSYHAIVQRRDQMIRCGFISRPPFGFSGDWLKLTSRGAEYFDRVLSGQEPAIFSNVVYLSKNKYSRPQGNVKYMKIPTQEYFQYIGSLALDGQSTIRS